MATFKSKVAFICCVITRQNKRVMNLHSGDRKHLSTRFPLWFWPMGLFNTLSKVKTQAFFQKSFIFFYWQTILKRSRTHFPVRRRGSNWWMLLNKDTRMIAQLEWRSPCLSGCSLPPSLWYHCCICCCCCSYADLTFPHCLSYLLICCLCWYQFLTCKYTRQAHTRDTDAQSTPTHSRADNICRGERSRN